MRAELHGSAHNRIDKNTPAKPVGLSECDLDGGYETFFAKSCLSGNDPFADVSVRLALAKKQPLGDLLEPQLFVVFLSNCGAKAAEDWSDYDIGLKLHRLDVRWRHGQHFVLRFNSYIN